MNDFEYAINGKKVSADDYIEYLILMYNKLKNQLEQSEQKINKAIEYIEFVGMEQTFDKILIGILKGE